MSTQCPKCGRISKVKDSRDTEFHGGPARIRRRWCRVCDHRWTTYEVPADAFARAERAAVNQIINTVKERLAKP